jgi:hypothetical protein
MGASVWDHHSQIEEAMPAPPYGSVGAPAGAYLGAAGGDALSKNPANFSWIVRTQSFDGRPSQTFYLI